MLFEEEIIFIPESVYVWHPFVFGWWFLLNGFKGNTYDLNE